MTYVGLEFEKKLKALPQDLQQAILNLDVYDKMKEIWNKNELLISESDELYQEVQKVLTGERKTDDFYKNVSSRLKDQDKETIDKIVMDVDEKIFQPLKEELKRVVNLKNSSEGGLKKDETEEDHLNLNKNDILSGLENPHPVSQSNTPAKNTSTVTKIKNPEDQELASIDQELNEMADEVVNEVRVEGKGEEAGQENMQVPKNVLEKKIDDLRNAGDIDVKKMLPTKNLVNNKLRDVVIAPKKEIEMEPGKIDPYREPAN